MRKHDKSFVNKKDIKIWLSNQKGPEDSAINRNKFIDNLIADVETGALLASEWGEEGYIISVELKNVHSLHELPDSKKYLVVFEDSIGSITSGELGIVTPEADTAGFSQNTLPDIYHSYDIGFYGSIKHVNFYDYEFAKMQFVGALKLYEASWGERVAFGDHCTHWYLLHIEYDLTTGEVLDYYTIDLGCLTCAPNSLCDELDGFGGGGGVLEQIEKVDKLVWIKMIGMNEIPGYNCWEISSTWRLRGTKNRTNPSLNRYTNIDYGGSDAVHFLPGAIVITPSHYYYFEIYSKITQSYVAPDGSSGTGIIKYVCVHPNQDPTHGANITVNIGNHVFTYTELN